MQINRGILGIGVRGRPGTGSARSWRPRLEAEISGRTHEILRGNVGASRGGHPEAPEPARLAGLFGRNPIPNVPRVYCVPGRAPGWEGTHITSGRCELVLGALERPEGFLEAVAFCRALEGTFIHSVKGVFIGAYCVPSLRGCTS